jgi:hypothetical protein
MDLGDLPRHPHADLLLVVRPGDQVTFGLVSVVITC